MAADANVSLFHFLVLKNYSTVWVNAKNNDKPTIKAKKKVIG